MENFVPSKQHLREILLYCFNIKKSAAEAHQLLVDAYGEHALSETRCRFWFRRFKSGNIDVEDKDRSGRKRSFENSKLQQLLEENPYAKQQLLAEALNVDQKTVSNHLHEMGMILKESKWVPHELTERNIEKRFTTCEMLLARQKSKGILHRIVTGDEKQIRFRNPKRKKQWVKRGQATKPTPKQEFHEKKALLCIWWDQQGVLYHELLKPGETVTADRYRKQLMKLKRAMMKKRPNIATRHESVILLHDNARPHVSKKVRKTLDTFGWEILSHPLYSPDIAPSDYHLFRSMHTELLEQRFDSYENVKKWVDDWIASKKAKFFRRRIRLLPERWAMVVANNGQYID